MDQVPVRLVLEGELTIDSDQVEFWGLDVENNMHVWCDYHVFSRYREEARFPGGNI